MFSTIFEVETVGGWAGIIKIGPLPSSSASLLQYERDILAVEAKVLQLIKASTNVPVPEVYLHDASCSIIKSPYILMERITGQSLDRLQISTSQQRRQAIFEQVGGFIKQINDIKGEYFGLIANDSNEYTSWREAFLALVGGVLADGKAKDVELPYQVIQGQLDRLAYLLDDVQTPRLLWWDGWEGNILVDDQGQVKGLIDFERALWGDPLMEISFLRPAEGLLKGYGDNPNKSSRDQGRRLLYTLHFSLVTTVEISYRTTGGEMEQTWRSLMKTTLEGMAAWTEDSGLQS